MTQKAYLDKLMENEEFKEKFEEEYKKLTIAENNEKAALVNSGRTLAVISKMSKCERCKQYCIPNTTT